MRKYLGIISIPIVYFTAYLIVTLLIEGTETGAMPLFVGSYGIVFMCWCLSYKGFWKSMAAVILIFIPLAFLIFSFASGFTNFGT